MKILFTLVFLFVAATQALAVDRTLVWNDNSNDEDGFVIQSCPGDCSKTGAWTNLAQTAADVRTLLVQNLKAGITSYRVAAFNVTGLSTWSNIYVDTIPMNPNAPTTLTRIACTGTLVVTPDPVLPDVWNVVCKP